MQVLLINPPFNIAKANYNTSIPLGLLAIASYLKEKGIKVKIIDGPRQKNWQDELGKEMRQADLVGISAMTMQVGEAIKISQRIKDFNKNLPVIWGGVHPTLFARETAEHPLIDAAVAGEGEEPLWAILNSIHQKEEWPKIKGLAFRHDGKITINPSQAPLRMEGLPLLDYSLLPEEVLESIALIPAYSSRGCPHLCSFCINSITKNKWRGYSSDRVLENLAQIKNNPHFLNKPLRFWDENFFTDLSRAKAIVRGMIERNMMIPWETTVRVDYIKEGMIDDDFLSLLKKSGCYLLSFGGESGSETILRKINKGIKPEQILFSAKQALKHGIIPQYSFMAGLPGESKKDIFQTVHLIDKLIKLSPQIQILGPQAFRPYPGSVLYDECVQSGFKAPQSLTDWAKAAGNELNFLSVRNFPWIADKRDLVESLEAYVRFGALSFESALGSTVKSNKLLKLAFILLCKLRWKLKFFKWPLEFKLARRFVTKM